jgi:hypothetical protein
MTVGGASIDSETRLKTDVPFIGILREPEHCHDKENADEIILRTTADKIASRGYNVKVIPSSEIDVEQIKEKNRHVIFHMCRSELNNRDLQTLRDWRHVIINTPRATMSCQRSDYMRILSSSELEENIPRYEMLHLGKEPSEIVPDLFESNGLLTLPVWLKSGNFHRLTPEDVSLVRTVRDATDQASQMKERDVIDAILQEHKEGREVKFYAVRSRGGELGFFATRSDPPPLSAETEAELKRIAQRIADIMNLDVFGGDIIIEESTRRLWLIDLNSWPSFLGFAEPASEAIADLLESYMVPRPSPDKNL